MAAPAAYSRRRFVGGAVRRQIVTGFNAAATSMVANGALTGWPSGAGDSFQGVINKGNSTEEKVWISSISGTTINFAARGADGTSAQDHVAGEWIELIIGKQDIDEANYAVTKTVGKVTTIGDILVADGANSLERLAKGTDGFPLVANSAAALDLAYERLGANGIATSVAGSGLSGGAGTALAVNVDDSTVAIVADTVKVKDAGITATQLAAAIAGNGLAGGAGTALSVNVDGTGIEISSDSLRLKDLGVLTGKINDLAVTTGKINDLAVTTGKLAVDAVTGAKIADDAIDSEHYVDGSIDTAHIGNKQVTAAKMADLAANTVLEGPSGGGTGVATSRGRSWMNSTNADSGGVDTTPTKINALNISSPALKAGRRYRMEFNGQMATTTGSGYAYIGFRKNNVAQNKYMTSELSAATTPTQNCFMIYEPGADEAVDWDIYIEAITNNVLIKAGATQKAFFTITDIGLASNA